MTQAAEPLSCDGAAPDRRNLPRMRLLLVAPLLLVAAGLVLVPGVWQRSYGIATTVKVPALVKQHPHDSSKQHLAGSWTDAPMAVLPPVELTCFVRHDEREEVGCPVTACSMDVSCSTRNTSCCAFINLQMMLFFDQFLTSKGLEGQYTLVYGSVLGAVRNHTVLPHTSDVDFGLSPAAIQFLEQNATREELWRRGYAFWADDKLWRLCPHQHHPSPDFQRLMQKPLVPLAHYRYSQQIGAFAGTCWLDGWLIWPVPAHTTNCTIPDPNLDIEGILGPASASSEAMQPAQKKLAAHTFCLHRGAAPITLIPGSRPVTVDGHRLPAPEDLERHIGDEYGPSWRTPDLRFHGISPHTPDADRVRKALHERLSVTVWGSMPWAVRRRRCGLKP